MQQAKAVCVLAVAARACVRVACVFFGGVKTRFFKNTVLYLVVRFLTASGVTGWGTTTKECEQS